MDLKIKKLVYLALFTALCTVATIAIPIPTPTGGYLNAGDIVVVLAALFTGPVCGSLIAGLGSAAADLFAGYAIYAPGSLLAKGMAAAAIGLVFRAGRRQAAEKILSASVCGELLMVLVYFCYEALALGFGPAAAAEIPGNVLQGIVGTAGGGALYHALMRVPEIRTFSETVFYKKEK